MSAESRRRWLFSTALLVSVAALAWPGLDLVERAYGDGPDAQGSVSGNDNFANAWTVTALPFVGEQDTSGMTAEPGEPLQPAGCLAGPSAVKGATVWYRYTPATSSSITAGTGGSSYDTVLAVYTGSSLGSLNLVACNDDSIGVQSRVTFNASAGVTYRIQVGGYDSNTGDLRLLVQGAPSPSPTPTPTGAPPAIPGDASCDGAVTSLDALFVLQFVAQLLPALPCQAAADVNGSGSVDAIDATVILQFVAGLLPAL